MLAHDSKYVHDLIEIYLLGLHYHIGIIHKLAVGVLLIPLLDRDSMDFAIICFTCDEYVQCIDNKVEKGGHGTSLSKRPSHLN